MKKATYLKFSNRLVQYSALSATLTSLVESNAQNIIYRDIPDISGTDNVWYDINLDGDGVVDFQIKALSNVLLIRPFGYNPPYGSGYNYNSILGAGPGANELPFALSSGASINSSASVWVNDFKFQSMNWNNCSRGYWCEVTNGYLGLRFDISGSKHYGWARLDVSSSPISYTLYDVAYNGDVGSGLTAGQGLLGTNDKEFSNLKIAVSNRRIAIYNLPETSNYNLYTLTGKSIFNGKTENDTYFIEANTLASGIYVIELKGLTSNAIIRKKIVLK